MTYATYSGFNKKHFLELTNLYIKKGLNKKLPYTCITRADVITDSWAKQAAKSGCLLVGMGLESGDDYIRMNVYNKKISKKQFRKAVGVLNKYKILYNLSYIFDGPGENLNSIRKGIKFARSLNPMTLIVIPYLSLVGTELHKKTEEENLIEYKKNTPRLKNNRTKLENFLIFIYIKIISFQILSKKIIKSLYFKKFEFLKDSLKYFFDSDNYIVFIKYPRYFILNFFLITYNKYIFSFWKKKKLS